MKVHKLRSAFDSEVRSSSARRYHVVVDYGSGAFVDKRSDSFEVAKKHASKLGGGYLVSDYDDGRFVIVDGAHVFVPRAVVYDVSGDVPVLVFGRIVPEASAPGVKVVR